MREVILLRKEIDKLDLELIFLLERRACFSKSIIFIKKNYNIPFLDADRENEIRAKFENSPYRDFLTAVYITIFNISKNINLSDYSDNSGRI